MSTSLNALVYDTKYMHRSPPMATMPPHPPAPPGKAKILFAFYYLSSSQSWANLDQTPNDLDKTIFRDLSPTPIPWVLEVCRNRHTFFGAALETIAEKSR